MIFPQYSPATGISQYGSDTAPKYLSSTDLSSRVGGLNPRWNQDSSAAVLDSQFRKAMVLAGAHFTESVDYLSNVRDGQPEPRTLSKPIHT